jgi:hypothetical protein
MPVHLPGPLPGLSFTGLSLSPNLFIVGPGSDANYPTITSAMDAVPWGLNEPTDDGSNPHNYTNRYTILVMPGYYEEQIVCKPWVNIVGVAKESVYIQPPANWSLPPTLPLIYIGTLRRANVYLNSFVAINNVTLLNRAGSFPTDHVAYGNNVIGVGMTNVDIAPLSKFPDSGPGPYARAKPIRLEGELWHTALLTAVGFSYLGSDGFAVEIVGGNGRGATTDVDSHIENCLFDALYVGLRYAGQGYDADRVWHYSTSYVGPPAPTAPPTSGCISVQDAFEVHVRNSLLRTRTAGAGVSHSSTGGPGTAGDVNSLIEGSTLYCAARYRVEPDPARTLHVGPGCTCIFRHSSADASLNYGAIQLSTFGT